jgi:hypothetical protein
MIAQNAVNPSKRGNIKGLTFHCFLLDINTAILFDKSMDEPIVWGNKNVVKGIIRKLPELLENTTARVRIVYYTPAPPEFKMKFKYDGPITKIVVPPY